MITADEVQDLAFVWECRGMQFLISSKSKNGEAFFSLIRNGLKVNNAFEFL